MIFVSCFLFCFSSIHKRVFYLLSHLLLSSWVNFNQFLFCLILLYGCFILFELISLCFVFSIYSNFCAHCISVSLFSPLSEISSAASTMCLLNLSVQFQLFVFHPWGFLFNFLHRFFCICLSFNFLVLIFSFLTLNFFFQKPFICS